MIEAGRTSDQVLRDFSEVAAQRRLIELRKLTSRIRVELYLSKPTTESVTSLVTALNSWRTSFPLVTNPRNVYETVEWRDLNYQRELLSIYHSAVLPAIRVRQPQNSSLGNYWVPCLETATQIIYTYKLLRAADRLVMNWTCVHDVISAGFTMLFCALAIHDSHQKRGLNQEELRAWEQQTEKVVEAVASCVSTLSLNTQKWQAVEKHLVTFRLLAEKAIGFIQSSPVDPYASQQRDGANVGTTPSNRILATNSDGAMQSTSENTSHMPELFDGIDWNNIDWETLFNLESDTLDLNDLMGL